MAVDHTIGQDFETITAVPARRGLPLTLALSAGAVASTVMISLVVAELPWWAKAQLTTTAVLALLLGYEVVRQLSPVRIDVTEGGLVVTRWMGTRTLAWHDIQHVTVHPSAGRFSDPVLAELPDMALEIRVTMPGPEAVETTADLTIVTVPAVDHTEL